ncbi:MAG: DUF4276 family protein [Desulfobaccales bacterium]|nr:DUF4276 family protein [Desulfobaccales bacterium]
MHFEFLVEEDSAEVALRNLLPKIIERGSSSYGIRVFQGKQDLLKKLPDRFGGYRRSLPDDWLILVLIDRDQEDCVQLKNKLERIAQRAGLNTKSQSSRRAKVQVLNRLAIEELEAWFFGDVTALHMAYPRISKNLDKKRNYRDPDAIQGGTWEALQRVLQRAGYYPGGLPKKEAARRISFFMDPMRNTSRSFQVL